MLATSNLTEGEKRLMDDSRSSNRSEQCQTPSSSSGYESAVGLEKRQGNTSNNNQLSRQPIQVIHRHHGHHQQHLVELSPASDYRRQFVLGPRLDRSPPTRVSANATNDAVPRRIGRANLLRQNAIYVTDIHIPNKRDVEEGQKNEWDDENLSDRIIPHPIWPSNAIREERSSQSKTATVVRQNENYVTKILISPRNAVSNMGPVVEEQPDDQEGFDSIVTHSLLVMTSYDGCKSSDDQPEDRTNETSVELADMRKLSQTLSQRRVVATVSRALSKSSGSSTTSGSETYSSYPTAPVSATRDPEGQHIHTVGGSIARRISLMRERWEKSSRRRLLVESDEDDATTLYRGLDHLYVPQNGDGNYSAAGQLLYRTNGDRSVSRESVGSSPFSYLAGVHQAAILEETVADGRLPHRPSIYGDSFEHDRLSNSSSRSSGSRRVTFSADTVDNEQSTRETSSSNSSGSSSGSVNGGDRNKTRHHLQPIAQELKLNPQYLPHRYQQPKSVSGASDRSRLAGYYSYNLQTLNELPDKYNYLITCTWWKMGIKLFNYFFSSANKGPEEKVSVWEHYHDAAFIKPLSTKSTSSGHASAGASITRMEPYGNLQLHPNYGAACQVSGESLMTNVTIFSFMIPFRLWLPPLCVWSSPARCSATVSFYLAPSVRSESFRKDIFIDHPDPGSFIYIYFIYLYDQSLCSRHWSIGWSQCMKE